MSQGVADPSALLQAVIRTQGEEQPATDLAAYLSTHPNLVLILLQPLIQRLGNDETTPRLKLWILDSALRTALSLPGLPVEQKSQLCTQTLDYFPPLLHDADHKIKKAATQCFASAYPLLFREACVKHNQATWDKVLAIKNTVLNSWTTSSTGVRVAATKAVQKIIQTQTRGNADPRMQHRVEPNLAMCPSSHPFLNLQMLEDEAKRLLEECGKQIYTSSTPDVMSAIINVYTGLIKARPALSSSIFTSMVNWDPSTLASASTCTPLQIRSVEKTFRIALAHLLRAGHATAFTGPITEFLHKQNTRMLVAAEEARQKKDEEATRKRERITDELSANVEPEGKKRKLDATSSAAATRNFASASARANVGDTAPNPLASFDVTTLPVTLVTELIIANLQVVTEATLAGAISDIRRELPAGPVVKDERRGPINPVADEDDELEIAEVEEEEEIMDVADRELDVFELAVSDTTSPQLQKQLLVSAVARICAAPSQGTTLQNPLWLSLISRLITKGLSGVEAEQDVVREALFEIIKEDLATRLPIAQTWLNEEWLSHPHPEEESPYSAGLTRILDTLLSPDLKNSEVQSRQISSFILDLPSLPSVELTRLHTLCQHQEHLQLGFTTLRDIVMYRTTNRAAALDALLSLATHTEKVVRNAAILTLKRWVPEVSPMAETITSFAIHLLSRLDMAVNDDMAIDDDDDETKPNVTPAPEQKCAVVQDAQVVSGLGQPTSEQVVVQHIELLLALSIKSPELLDQLFESYSRMAVETQTHIQKLITMLVRSMGAKNAKILDLIKSAPAGAEELVLRVIAILTEKGKTAPPLVALIKEMATERELSPRYMVAVVADLDKPELVKMLPKILSLASSSPADKALVKSVIENVLAQQQGFGTVSTNLPRNRQSELLTPVEFLILLHNSVKETGLEPTKEVISMCLSMQDIFRPEILAAFMQQVIDEPVLPALFLRTVIQAATMHKSLQPYVSSNLLSRLITKKVWTTPSLWEGFIRCAKTTAPHSFGTLLQLPKEQLREVIQKQPNLQQPLRDHVIQKFGTNKVRLNSLLESLGGDTDPARSPSVQ